MTPEQAQVWTRYHKASEMLADATYELILAEQRRRAGRWLRDDDRAEQIARGLLAEYRAARAAMEALR